MQRALRAVTSLNTVDRSLILAPPPLVNLRFSVPASGSPDGNRFDQNVIRSPTLDEIIRRACALTTGEPNSRVVCEA